MCLAVPAKIISVADKEAQVEMAGVIRTVGLDLVPDARVDDYVLVHAGFAIQVVSEADALDTLRMLKEITDHEVS